MAPGSTGPRGPLLLVKFWQQDEGDFSTLLNFQADDSLKDEKIDKQREWPRCGVVYCNWTLLNTKLRSSPAYSRKKRENGLYGKTMLKYPLCLLGCGWWLVHWNSTKRAQLRLCSIIQAKFSHLLLHKFTHPNVSGTALVITYLNDHPRHRTTTNKGWLNRLQEGRA